MHGRSHEFAERLFWLRRAAAETNTFYGIIARHSLKPFVGCLVPPRTKLVVSGADVESLLANPAGRRAFALLQRGGRPLGDLPEFPLELREPEGAGQVDTEVDPGTIG